MKNVECSFFAFLIGINGVYGSHNPPWAIHTKEEDGSPRCDDVLLVAERFLCVIKSSRSKK